MLNLGVSYATLGRHQDAIDQWLKGATLHADYYAPRASLASNLMALGRWDEGLAWALEAYKLDQGLPSFGVASAYQKLGNLERAVAVLEAMPPEHPWHGYFQSDIAQLNGGREQGYAILKATIESFEHPPWWMLNRAANYAIEFGDFEAARDYLLRASPELADRKNPEVRWQNRADQVALAYAAKKLGEDEYADTLLSRSLPLLEDRPRMGTNGYGIFDVTAYAVMGETDRALAKLREAVDAGWRAVPFVTIWSLEEIPYLESLRDEPEFQAMVAEINADLARMRESADEAEASGNWQPLLDRARQVPVANAAP